MGVIKSVILDEYNRNKRMQDTYNQEIALLPRGSITRKHIKGHDYFYLMYRQDGKVVNKYLSSKNNDVELLRKQIARRKQLENLLRSLKKEQLDMERFLRGNKNG